MQTIIEALEEKTPKGPWCHGWIQGKARFCEYHERKKPTLTENGSIQSNYCHLMEEYIVKKECGINED